MLRKATITTLSFLALFHLESAAQQIAQGISSPVSISVMSASTGISKPVHIEIEARSYAYSKPVHINVGSATTSSSAIVSKQEPKNTQDLASHKVVPVTNKVAEKSESSTALPSNEKLNVNQQKTQPVSGGMADTKSSKPSIDSATIKGSATVAQRVDDKSQKSDDRGQIKKEEQPSNAKLKSEDKKSVVANQTEQKTQEIKPTVNPVVSDQKPANTKLTDNAAVLGVGAQTVKATTQVQSEAVSIQALTPESSNVPKYYALLIGVSNYIYASSSFTNLDQPVSDVEKLAKVLVERYEFAPSNVKKLLDPTRLQILDELDQLARNIKEQDNLLIFYAGHGKWDPRSQLGYWLPSDARPDRKAEWIPNSTLQDYINSIYSKHTLLISDACFGGSIFKERKADFELNEFATSKLYQLQSRKAMTSGNLMTVPDRSKFLEYMVKRLNENEDRFLPARILFDRIYLAVINNTNTVPLYGVVHNTGDEGGEFIFIKRTP